MEITPVEIWLAVGIIFILAELAAIPGIGLLFIGLGALSTSILIYYMPSLASYQVASVGLISLAWFLILWWPLKAFIYRKKDIGRTDYFDMIGMQVEVVEKDLNSSSIGKVLWSGTIMNAKLDVAETGSAKMGEWLYIIEVKGNVLICGRKKIQIIS
jgi:membrane protein implicated in regulation of membrane protease activity